jgi:hypothetical protein
LISVPQNLHIFDPPHVTGRVKSRRVSIKPDVRFTPKSGHLTSQVEKISFRENEAR